MTSLLELKQYINNFIGKYEAYLKPVGKLILALIVFMSINGKIGYMGKIDNSAVVMIAALICSFMPFNFIIMLGALFIVLHMYALSLECAIVVLVLFLVLFLLYMRLAPSGTIGVAITPILTSMGIPYIMPVAMGLNGGPAAAASVGCGVIVGRVVGNISKNADTILAMDTEDMPVKLKFIIDNILADKAMILLVVAFAITAIIVYIIGQLSIDYAWPIAIVAGAVADIIIILIGKSAMKAELSVGGLLMGSILAVVVGFIVQFFTFNLDYTRTEVVQFQDDDYVYYVKAVPKRTARRVKRGPARKRKPVGNKAE